MENGVLVRIHPQTMLFSTFIPRFLAKSGAFDFCLIYDHQSIFPQDFKTIGLIWQYSSTKNIEFKKADGLAAILQGISKRIKWADLQQEACQIKSLGFETFFCVIPQTV
eukprot:GABV01014335.1.p1 GENE.GABV01014335.1~~GABV01014335.1.p1  ORF type:complete len:109 (+),score=27.28 GABV01014335.1:76-402(+)